MLGGFIAAAFYLVGAPAALLFGWLSDKVNRKRLLFAAVVLGALARRHQLPDARCLSARCCGHRATVPAVIDSVELTVSVH